MMGQAAEAPRRRRQNAAELWADGIVHLLGSALAIVGSIALLVRAAPEGNWAVAVYLIALLLSLFASAAFNIWNSSPAHGLLRRADHAAIYLLIAGTYTPVLARIQEWMLLAVVWSVAIVGCGVKILRPGKYDRLAVCLYLVLGWSGVVIADKLVSELPSNALLLLGIGGLIYTLGVVFHLWQSLRFQNAIWHSFVLAAAACHYAAIWTLASTL